MIREVTGIETIRMLYLQLLYRCNFACLHCFHGERLQHADAFTVGEAAGLLTLMRDEYGTEAVTLLGGEPFVYRELPEVVRYAKEELGLRVEICTNGYRVERRLARIASHLDVLRVSLEGVGATNDAIRRTGSFTSALDALRAARDLGVPTGATMTLTSRNIADVLPLAHTLADLGVQELKLHHMRPVGNAAAHPELLVSDVSAYGRLRAELAALRTPLEIVVDEEISATGGPATCATTTRPRTVHRIEADPRGALTLSCNAVGNDAYAFWYEKSTGRITHRPSAKDELSQAVPDVVYARA
ncbi:MULTISPECIES: radical SAM protein [Streptomyces]|uniref:radical SAM protein n=1 Tax=Streptomyces TaxID=1883 RepID=UPI002885AEE7|nr:radical SAM protein [Streptomyces sp. DSM 41859]MDT0421851.1 radical SAM protein [Streptomyces sp. DSM 41859]